MGALNRIAAVLWPAKASSQCRKFFNPGGLVPLGFAIVYAGLLFTQARIIPLWGYWYVPGVDYHAAQSDAILRGTLKLSESPAALRHDLAWSRGGVHQVWGLGIPLLRLPFIALSKLAGPFLSADRIMLLLLLVVGAFFAVRFVKHHVNGRSRISLFQKIGLLSLVVFFPPMLRLLETRLLIYESVFLYVFWWALLLYALLHRCVMQFSKARLFLLCACCGFAAFIRPTLVFYGAISVVLVVGYSWFIHRARIPILLGGMAIYLFFSGLLFVTNHVRFGNGFEFGHKLNLQSGPMHGSMYATRFSYPFAAVSWADAFQELFSLIFVPGELNGSDYYRDNFFPGEANCLRWREIYFRPYDLTYPILLAAGVLAIAWRGLPAGWRSSKAGWTTALPAIWGLLCVTAVGVFYLRVPCIASRYLMDFAPGFCVLLAAGWFHFSALCWRRFPQNCATQGFLLLLLLAWLLVENMTGQSLYNKPISVGQSSSALSFQGVNTAAIHLPDKYQPDFPFSEAGIPFNGSGWKADGSVSSLVVLFLDNPGAITIQVSATVPDKELRIRARLANEDLRSERIICSSNYMEIKFAAPSRAARGIQPLFLAFGPAKDLNLDPQPYKLHAVQSHLPN